MAWMEYQEFAPSSQLRPFVKCYWQLEGMPDVLAPENVAPDGRMEMIFHYGDAFQRIDGETVLQPKSLLTGQITNSIALAPTGKIGIFAVRFRPQGFTAIFEESAAHISNRIIGLEEFQGNLAKEIEDQICSAEMINSRVERIENYLMRNLSKSRIYDRHTRAAAQFFLKIQKRKPSFKLQLRWGCLLQNLSVSPAFNRHFV